LADWVDEPVAVPSAARSLHLAFPRAEGFRQEYARNLIKGGAFVPTDEYFEPRELVDVRLDLPFVGETLMLSAEVVYQIPRGSGDGPGVAIQFLDPAPELRSRFEAILALAAEEQGPEAPAFDDRDLAGLELGDADAVEGSAELGASPPEGFESTSVGGEDPNERTYRQRAERSPARVPVRVKGPTGVPILARTRDLSTSGVLLSVEGEELPVGREVELELSNPATGQHLAVGGKVVRHVEGEGVVPAVAVQMRPGPQREAMERFIEDVKRIDEEQRRGGIRGPLEELGAVSLLQMFAALAQRGTLTVTCGVEEGMVAFEGGQLLNARVGSVTGVKALARIFSWRDGFFEFRGGHVDPELPASDALLMEGAILDALRILDEAGRTSGVELAPATRFAVHRERLARISEPLGKTEEAVLELAVAGFTLRRILDVIPESDSQIREAIAALIERGLLSTG